ncbi:MAG: hypothetical protein K0U47_05120 [Epsilonproteobacteria bacterium]|nr:hypothetical protein [Campylobacterota bacterium]
MNNCFIKYCIPFALILSVLFFFMIANYKPELIKENFANFIDLLQVEKEDSSDQKKDYTTKNRPYSEPSAFESSPTN